MADGHQRSGFDDSPEMGEGAAALRRHELEAAYEQAYREWADTEEAILWDVASGDGIGFQP